MIANISLFILFYLYVSIRERRKAHILWVIFLYDVMKLSRRKERADGIVDDMKYIGSFLNLKNI